MEDFGFLDASDNALHQNTSAEYEESEYDLMKELEIEMSL